MFDIRIREYTPLGVAKGVVDTLTLEVTHGNSNAPTIRFTTSELVAGRLTIPLVFGLEYSVRGGPWVSPRNNLFIAKEDDADVIQPGRVVSFSGMGLIPWLMGRTHLHWSGSAKNGQRTWTNRNAGYIFHGMLTESRPWGWAPQLTWDFNASTDSNGVAWPVGDKITKDYPLLIKLAQVLDGLSGDGLCEWWTEGLTFRMFKPGTGVDRSTGVGVVRLGSDAERATVRSSYDNVFTNLTVVGEKLRSWVYLANADVVDRPFGTLEESMTLDGVKDAPSATRMAQPQLVQGKASKRQISVSYQANGARFLPWVDYNVGDALLVDLRGNDESRRVVEIVVQKSNDGVVTVSTILDARFHSLLARLAGKSAAGSMGAITGGTGIPLPNVRPQLRPLPKAPTGLAEVSNVGIFDAAGQARSRVAIEWAPVTQYVDDSDLDIQQYEVFTTVGGRTKRVAATAELSFEAEFAPNVPVAFTVRARGIVGDWSEMSAPLTVTPALVLTVPDAPDAPTLTCNLGVVTARWSGLLAGATPPLGFTRVTGQWRVGAGSWAALGESGAAGIVGLVSGQATGSSVQVRFAAVNSVGVSSAFSTVATITVTGIELPDVGGTIQDAIDAAFDKGVEAEGIATQAGVDAGLAQGTADDAASAATAAQGTASTALSDAATAAGIANGKGKVLIQATAPGAPDRNAQTLWIDTTGGSNTPKKWVSGTTWAAVTDKAATDAASAAVAAQGTANTAVADAATAKARADSAHTLAGTANTNANTAITSANARNQLFHALTDATGTARKGDIWHKWSSLGFGGVLLGTWRSEGGTDWTKTALDASYIPLLDIGAGTFGSLNGARMEAKSIGARQVVLGDLSNMAEINESIPDSVRYQWSHTIVDGWSTRSDQSNTYFMFRNNAGPVPFKTGDRLRLSFEVYAAAEITANPYIWTYPGASGSQAFGTGFTITTTPQIIEREAVVTVNTANRATFLIGMNGSGLLTTDVFVRNARAYVMNAGELVVDGAITARKLNAIDIWASTAWLSEATVAILTAGSIDSQMLTVGTRFAQGESQQRVPAPATDMDYWGKVISGEINLSPVGKLRTTATAAGLSLTGSGGTAYIHITATNPVPLSGKVHVTFLQSGVGVTAVVRWYNAAGGTVSNTIISSGATATAPALATAYGVYLQLGSGLAASVVAAARVFEVVGTGLTGQQSIEMSPSEFIMRDDTGSPVVQLTTQGDTFISVQKNTGLGMEVQASINADGNILGQSVAANSDVSVRGSDLAGGFIDTPINGLLREGPLFDRIGWGGVVEGDIGVKSWNETGASTAGRRRLIALGSVELTAGRVYEMGTIWDLFVRYVMGTGLMSGCSLDLHVSTAAQSLTAPTITNGGLFTASVLASVGTSGDQQWNYGVTFPSFTPTVSGVYNLMLTARIPGTAGTYFAILNAGKFRVSDVGAETNGLDGGTWAAEFGKSTGAAAPPAATWTTRTYNMAWSRSWNNGGGSIVNGSGQYDNSKMLYQGYGNSSMGAMMGWSALGLTGKTISKVEIYMRNRHTEGGGAIVANLGASSAGYGAPASHSLGNGWSVAWGKGVGAWVTVPSSQYAAIASGAIRSFCLAIRGGEYGYWDGVGAGDPPKIRITYK